MRLGQVVLRWQDAYAAAYRVQVSADGHNWRTAATVSDGRGGRESVRMDARDIRFIRVQGDAGDPVRVFAVVGGGVRGGGLTARSPFPRILGRSHHPPLFTQYM